MKKLICIFLILLAFAVPRQAKAGGHIADTILMIDTTISDLTYHFLWDGRSIAISEDSTFSYIMRLVIFTTDNSDTVTDQYIPMPGRLTAIETAYTTFKETLSLKAEGRYAIRKNWPGVPGPADVVR